MGHVSDGFMGWAEEDFYGAILPDDEACLRGRCLLRYCDWWRDLGHFLHEPPPRKTIVIDSESE
jgi:hypothetical protein